MRASRFASLAAALTVFASALAASANFGAAWLRDGELAGRNLPAAPVPVGSLWKLFTYAQLVDANAQEPPYVCTSHARKASDPEHHCCAPGESIGRDVALARSCGAYFDHRRLGLPPPRWREDSRASVRDILEALDGLSVAARGEARRALLEVSLAGYGRDAWRALGSGVRFKTWTWDGMGGAAGWLADGTPFWFGARGASRSALRSHAQALAAALPEPRDREPAQAPCVEVDFFVRYPVKAVLPAATGRMHGAYRIAFENGNWLRIDAGARGELAIDADRRISGRFTLNDYVARVIDREGGGAQTAAARALAVAARSYLVQNAGFEAGCWRIADSTRTQRVSPNPPSAQALAAAKFTDDLVLRGVPVRYHRDAPAPNRMSWRDALEWSRDGAGFDAILARAYPEAELAGLAGGEDCRRIGEAEAWLARAADGWRRQLHGEPGFEPPGAPLRVCALAGGNPYADQQRLRIYARDWRTREGRLALAHEYLHLALRFHPNGADEAYVERLARRLLEL